MTLLLALPFPEVNTSLKFDVYYAHACCDTFTTYAMYP